MIQKLTARERRIENFFELPMIVLTIVLVPVLAIPHLFTVPEEAVLALGTISLLIWAAFYLELFVKLSVAKNLKEALKRNWLLVIILLSPLLLSFRLVRLARLISVIRLLRLQSVVGTFTKTVRSFVYNLEYVALAFAITVTSAAFVVWRVEEQSGGSITDFSEALWWAIITVTTIGYGDIVPESAAGRLVGATVGFIGVLIFMIFTARLTAFFVHGKSIQ